MDTPNDDSSLEPRFPTLEDFLFLCRKLNEAGAKYIVIGGWAVIHHGFNRTTEDIDLLVEVSQDNFERPAFAAQRNLSRKRRFGSNVPRETC